MGAAAKQATVLTFEERMRYLDEFSRLEKFEALCTIEHVMAVYDVCRRSIYNNRKLMAKRKKRGARGIGFLPSDVRACYELRGAR